MYICRTTYKVKLKKIILIFIAVVLVSFSFIEEKVDQDSIDLKSSNVFWEGSNSFRNHRGIIKFKSGSIRIINSELKSGEFVVDMTTIFNREGFKKLEEHLKSEDFFDVKKYPTAKFLITSVAQEFNKVKISGDITIKGITKNVTVSATILENDKAYIVRSGVFKLNRAEFNVRHLSKSFFKNLKDNFIEDEVDVSFSIRLNK